MTTYEKIEKLCRKNGLSVSSLSEKVPGLKVSRASITGWKKGSEPRPDKIKAIADFFNVPISYFSDDEKLPPQIGTGDNKLYVLDSDNIYMVPLFESVSAGFGSYPDDHIIGHVPCYISSRFEAKETICIKVRGDSMSPKIEDGDTVQVHRQTSVDSGCIAVVMVDDDAFVKKIVYDNDYIELHSLNSDYKTVRLEGPEVLRVQVLGLVKKIIKEV